MATSPKRLDRNVEVVLRELIYVFGQRALRINRAPGKNAANAHGRNAHVHMDARRDAKGKIWTDLPHGAAGGKLEVVTSFRHVGSRTHDAAMFHADALDKPRACDKAYRQLAGSVFSAKHFEVHTKLSLASSLLWSRLLCGVHTWSRVPARPLRTLEVAHMRPLRRIANKSCFSAEDNVDDHTVRSTLGQPSVECVLRQRRLLYLVRIVLSAPPSLLALLQFRSPAGVGLPWARMVLEDVVCLWEFLPHKLGSCPTRA